ncbi:MAG: hypothetical protein R3C03_03350 [Pirellulaceae bacterium]
MKDWFRRKPSPKEVGKSPGGSRLIKYGDGDALSPRSASSKNLLSRNTEDRERIYSELFGESDASSSRTLAVDPTHRRLSIPAQW